jgi:parallel beta-helix repeat protein
MIDVLADDVSITGFEIQGIAGVTRGIRGNEVNNLVITNNILSGMDRAAQYNGSITGNTGGVFTGNLVQNLTGSESYGVLAFDSAYVSVTSNVMTGLDVGVFEQYFYQANGIGNGNNVISGNDITADILGYGTNERGTGAATTALSNNTFTITGGAGSIGVQMFNIYKTNGITLTSNTIVGADVGVYAFISGGSATISGGSIDGNGGTFGVQLTNYLADFTYAATGDGALTITGVAISNVTTGVFVEDSASGAFNVAATINGNTEITSTSTGVLVSGADASATITSNNASIHGNLIGIDVSGGSATISSNHVYDNATGIRFTAGGGGSVTGNNFNDSTDNGTDVRIDASAGTVTFGASNSFAGDDYYIDNRSSQSFDFSGVNVQSYDQANNFRIEDRLYHATDNAASGLIRVVAGQLFVSAPGTGASDETIQRAINAATAGNTVNIEAGTYVEALTINKSITLDGEGSSLTPVVTITPPYGKYHDPGHRLCRT